MSDNFFQNKSILKQNNTDIRECMRMDGINVNEKETVDYGKTGIDKKHSLLGVVQVMFELYERICELFKYLVLKYSFKVPKNKGKLWFFFQSPILFCKIYF